MKNVLGRNLRKKKAISTEGKELGKVEDAYFEEDGRVESVIIQPHRALTGVEEYLNDRGFLIVSFENIKAIGEYVVINFPPE